MNNELETTTLDLRWKDLYKLAGIAAVVSITVILLGVVTFFIWPYSPQTKSTEEILVFLQDNPFGGLVSLDLFLFIGNLFAIFTFLALYVSLKPVNESYALIALAVGLVGLVLLIPSRPIFEMFALSGKYTAATTEATKSQILASAGAVLALFDGTGWFMNTLLGSISLLASSLLMLRSKTYSKATAYAGIITNGLICGFFIPVLGKFLLFLAMPGYMIWYFLLARRFFELGRSDR